jgi:glycosyltransferase involved in cell wall biosynthesis
MVSVIIPVYNVQDYIEKCISSVCCQTYIDLEILIVNDGSTDETPIICRELAKKDSRIVLIDQANQGVVAARQSGIEKASGDFIAFVDGDDWIEPDMIEEMVSNIGNADLISVGVFKEKQNGCVDKIKDSFPSGTLYDIDQIRSQMLYGEDYTKSQPLTPYMVNKLYIANKVKKLHPRLNKDLKFAEDHIFVCMYLMGSSSIAFKEDCYYHYRYNIVSSSRKVDPDKLVKLSNAYKNMLELFKSNYLDQIQGWLLTKCYFALNEDLGFNSTQRILRYIADIPFSKADKIVLYGAGRVGLDLNKQLNTLGYNVVLWVDRMYEQCQAKGLPVNNIEKIISTNYDYIYIAIENSTTQDAIVNDLLKMNININCIIKADVKKLF